jgi:hypothetical protein
MPDYRGKLQSVKNAQRLGQARAHMGLKQWPEAIKTFDVIQDEHAKAACLTPCPCRSLARKLLARAAILETLEREADAAVDRKRAGRLGCPRSGKIRFHPDRFEQETFNRLKGLLARKEGELALEYIDDIIVNGKDGRQAERNTFAGLLQEQAKILTQIGKEAEALTCRQWAEALTLGIETKATDQDDAPRREQRYVDVVKEQQ